MANSVHGHTTKSRQSLTYKSWHSMKQRCLNPNDKQFKDYGGRGIDIAPDWMYFDNFLAFMGERPPGTVLDRRNKDRGYRPGNCFWATKEQHMRNRRNNVWLELDGERMILKDWADSLGLDDHSLKQRLQNGWDLRRALTTPGRNRNREKLSSNETPSKFMHANLTQNWWPPAAQSLLSNPAQQELT